MFADPLALEQVMLERDAAPRSRKHEDPAVQRALNLVNDDLNPVKLTTPQEAAGIYKRTTLHTPSENMIAFRAPSSSDPNIYVNKASEQYKRAVNKPNDKLAQLLLAASLVHEQTHDIEGSEYAPRRLEADFLRSRRKDLNWDEQAKLDELIMSLDSLAQPLVGTTGKTNGKAIKR